jgi:polygalacturonase
MLGVHSLGWLVFLTGCAGAEKGQPSTSESPQSWTCPPGPSSTLVVNVTDTTYGAKGDGRTDDTAAIQKAIGVVGGTGGTVYIPAGTYMVNALGNAHGSYGIALESHMKLTLHPQAVLKAIPNASSTYAILYVGAVSDVIISGGTVEGDRSTHLGSGGESGVGVYIASSQCITLDSVTAKECWGDGFYVEGSQGSRNITLVNVTADHNRRQGLSIVRVDGMVVRNSTFKNSIGASPESGIDIEPNDQETVNNVTITGCTFANNAGGGFLCGPRLNSTNSYVTNVVLESSRSLGNGVGAAVGSPQVGIGISNCSGTKVLNNSVSDNYGNDYWKYCKRNKRRWCFCCDICRLHNHWEHDYGKYWTWNLFGG